MSDAIHPACALCRGACCEYMQIKYADKDSQAWCDLHGTPDKHGTILELPCKHLRKDGQCGIYEVRPLACFVYKVDGEHCRSAVQLRRPEKAVEILRRMK
jgi:Fe-S-cluster containining protein